MTPVVRITLGIVCFIPQPRQARPGPCLRVWRVRTVFGRIFRCRVLRGAELFRAASKRRNISGSSSATRIFSEPPAGRGTNCTAHSTRFTRRREPEDEFGSDSDFAFYVDAPAGLLNDSVYDAQTQSCAFRFVLCGEKRIENLRQHLALDTGACVADPHDYIGALAARRESDNAAIRHSIARVDREVQEKAESVSPLLHRPFACNQERRSYRPIRKGYRRLGKGTLACATIIVSICCRRFSQSVWRS